MTYNNPLQEVHKFDQSLWLDFIRRGMLVSGELEKLINDDGIRGMTSNPSIFEKAIVDSKDYQEAIESLAHKGLKPEEVYERLIIDDIRHAADLFRPLYDESNGGDGYVSIEVNPHLAHETEKTIKEARHLWKTVDRPNVMIKIPGTTEGLQAIRQAISEGINVNVTLLFDLDRYREVADAFLSGLEDRMKAGKPIDNIASVASFFLSRIDVLVDPMLEDKMKGNDDKATLAKRMHGQVAIASARIAYEIFKEIYSSDRYSKIKEADGGKQRLLWASTSTKNPDYSDVKYVEALIGSETVNTIPMETVDAFRDHGKAAPRLENNTELAREILDRLPNVDIDLKKVTQQLEDEGVEKFNKPYDKLIDTLSDKMKEASTGAIDSMDMKLGSYDQLASETMSKLESKNFVKRMWDKDASLWKDDPDDQKIIRNAMGWMDVADKMIDAVPRLDRFAREVRDAGFTHVVHMGMGGSSLAPIVFEQAVTRDKDGLPLNVLDSTDPAAIIDIEENHPLETTLFIVATKSGTTAETRSFADYFYEKVKAKKGDKAGENFVAITDPGSPLTDLAKEKGYRKTFLNFVDIGGRYSALSYFGLVPAVLKGVRVGELLERTMRMLHACSQQMPVSKNPAVQLGAAIGAMANNGRDKITFIMPDNLATLGMWLEQLLAESTGKEDTGILPVTGEALLDPGDYSDDRIFVHFSLIGEKDSDRSRKLQALEKDGHPVISIQLDDVYDIGQEFVRWEFATATAGSVLGINAFNQPNVQESKDNTKRLLKEVADKGHMPEKKPAVTNSKLKYYADWYKSGGENILSTFFSETKHHDYIAIQAFLTENEEVSKILQDIRTELQHTLNVAVTLGYGPRFLHSTGQFHKGGTNSGLFLQLTMNDPVDRSIPGRPYGYSTLRQAQAIGDMEALGRHDRRVLRVDVGDGLVGGLKELKKEIQETCEKLGHKHVAG